MKTFFNLAQFAEFIAQFIGSVFAPVESETEPKVNKKSRTTGEPCPFKKVVHARYLDLQIGYNYEDRVTANAQAEGILAEDEKFNAEIHKWARPLCGAVARHMDYKPTDIFKGISVRYDNNGFLVSEKKITVSDIDWTKVDLTKLYMPYAVKKIKESTYFADGKIIALDMLRDYFPPTTDKYQSQPAEKKLHVQYMKLSSVKRFEWSGTEYVIVK